VGAKNVATISGYYILHGCEVEVSRNVRPIALDNVVVNRNPAFFELFPTSKATAHAAIILPSRTYKPERSLQKEFFFILNRSHYAEQIRGEIVRGKKSYFGIVPVGRLHRPALDRIVFFGEAGQANPAASATPRQAGCWNRPRMVSGVSGLSGLSGPRFWLSGLASVRVRAVSGLSGLKPLFGRARTLTSLKALRILNES